MSRSIRDRRGLTLLEVLAVVVIVSLAGAMITISLTNAGDETAFRAARATVQELDAKARLFGRSGHVASLAVNDDGSIAVVSKSEPPMSFAQTTIPSHMTIHLEVDGSIVPRVTFDRLGRSESYAVALCSGDRSKRWIVAGLTGWMTREDDAR